MREEKRIENEKKLNALRGYDEIKEETSNPETEEIIEEEQDSSKGKKIVFYTIIFIILLFLYINLIGTRIIEVHEYKIESNKIAESFDGFKIVHFTDIHYGTIINEKELKKIITKINELKPDIVVFTGDLFNTNISLDENSIKIITDNLKNINVSLYKYAVIGNEDDQEQYKKIMDNSDFIILNNEIKLIYNNDNTPLLISGFANDSNTNYTILNNNIDDIDTSNLYKIILTHQPDYIDDFINYKPDLVLAGHTLGGTIKLPLIKPLFLEEGGKKYYKKTYDIDNTKIFISNGLGTSGINMRFNNRPSINLYRLYVSN